MFEGLWVREGWGAAVMWAGLGIGGLEALERVLEAEVQAAAGLGRWDLGVPWRTEIWVTGIWLLGAGVFGVALSDPDPLKTLCWGWILVLLCGTDLRAGILPDRWTVGGIWLGLLWGIWGGVGPSVEERVLGAVLGYLGMAGCAGLFLWWRGEAGVGRGDWKILALCGAWLGVIGVPMVLLLASVLALVCEGGLRCARVLRPRAVPFGPYVCGSAGVFGWLQEAGWTGWG